MANTTGSPVQSSRTVKTLLMCKVRPSAINSNDTLNYSDIYRDIRTGTNGRRYITLGNADAVSIYDTCEANKTDWFSKLYDDKQEIIFAANSKLNYHPIHLVSNREYPKEYPDKPICVITLIYGVRRWTKEPDDDCTLSSYELKLQRVLDPLKANSSHFDFEIYNAVNICDAVILWYTDDLWEVLSKTEQLTSKGFARKTFTLIGFPMSDNGDISETIYDVIRSFSNPTPPIHVRILGSIRNQSDYRAHLDEISQRLCLSPAQIKDYLICGQTDFSALIPISDNEKLVSLLKHFMDLRTGRRFASTYWEIHSELMYDDPAKDINKSFADAPNLPAVNSTIGPECILDKLYKQCREIIRQNFTELSTEFPWLGAFIELINVHSNIDRDPILYGPGFLIYNTLKVILWYLEQRKHNHAIFQMLRYSRDSIQEFLQALCSLTDQMMRIDDLVFHGFGNNSALYNTLPECALDFYHSFLLKFVNLLVDIDESAGRLAGNRTDYIYDFLLMPELQRGIAIIPMFTADDLPRLEPKNPSIRALWPQKQVFLVHFPIETVYSPVNFFAPLVHECFHLLGDVCRLRGERVTFICAFFASMIATHFSCGSNDEPDKNLVAFFFNRLIISFPEDLVEPNIPETERYLEKGIRQLFTAEGLDALRAKHHEEFLLYTSEFVRKWADGATAFGSQENNWKLNQLNADWFYLIRECTNLFKECYADLMMILTLGLSSQTYLSLFQEDVSRAEKEIKYPFLAREAQRIALVLDACTNYPFSDTKTRSSWTPDEVQSYVSAFSSPQHFLETLNDCYIVLQDRNAPIPESMDQNTRYKLFPRASIQYVSLYLNRVVDAFTKTFVSFVKDDECSTDLKTMQKEFKHFFIDGHFISNDYFQVIRDCHVRIRNDRDPNQSASLA